MMINLYAWKIFQFPHSPVYVMVLFVYNFSLSVYARVSFYPRLFTFFNLTPFICLFTYSLMFIRDTLFAICRTSIE